MRTVGLLLCGLAVVAGLGVDKAAAHSSVFVGVGVGAPVYPYYHPYYYHPYYGWPPTVAYVPPPVIYSPPPVVYAPPPAVYQQPTQSAGLLSPRLGLQYRLAPGSGRASPLAAKNFLHRRCTRDRRRRRCPDGARD